MQASLFADEELVLPEGMRFTAGFLSAADEARWLDVIRAIELHVVRYKQYVARRRSAAFGGRFDYDTNTLREAPPIPPELQPLREQVAAWLGIEPERFTQLLVAEYRPGTPLGWHRDAPDFESIVGVSLAGSALMRLRPYPPPAGPSKAVRHLELPPRSAYVLEGPARWTWQHSIAETRELRYSISMRTARGAAPLLR
ncbi:alpha-ketoglutarate-dependent dioxygenase AlkB [Aquincola sp. S2]|uniref:Alpha-ketoglutarate-dependent dioxygenase AlkB n=1 Tax=Pseudaquabacterium terrae TaxID=2732868 RepID=A0ABX2E9E9_9BURK|nr:alpha-ketoglutarate-dependent dioxygenase AlkB [Aquabacterium terrae]NRF65601.1 alpha-ketoglutarate-dependent dioxygenase AlkB [Aquabacterium terrae]